MTTREYRYVGPESLAEQATASIERLQPQSEHEIRRWMLERAAATITLTFVVDRSGALWLSGRGTEHVACARGAPVLGAGELVLQVCKLGVDVISVTNQSTGYCPEPSCWPAVRTALERAGLQTPPSFAHEFDFRRCTTCGTINVLKSGYPECPVCDADLPAEWNLD